ncbi:MAG: hypothetical protein P1P81_09370, partial [Desulfobulbales bacterium]|nr:hypothetical protein [Desulfobulbales bacterium]
TVFEFGVNLESSEIRRSDGEFSRFYWHSRIKPVIINNDYRKLIVKAFGDSMGEHKKRNIAKDKKKDKNRCCEKYVRKGKQCGSCPLKAQCELPE